MKKRILIVANDMEIGGAERALLGLLDAIDYSSYQVDLFLFRHTGPFLELIPSCTNLLPESIKYTCLAVPFINVIKKKCYGVAFGRIIGKLKAKRYLKKNHIVSQNSVELLYSLKYTKKHLPMITDQQYDLAIGFTTPYYVVAEKVDAKQKIVWIHTDYSRENADKQEEAAAWNAYDKLVGVSNAVCDSFIKQYPHLAHKVMEMDNIVSASIIRQQSSAFSVEKEMPDDGYIKLLSIGRFCYAKNFDNVPDICKRVLNKGLKIKWYLIGYGNDEALIQNRIIELGVKDNVIILGKKENPYPYIKRCDFYIQPSRFEGRCVTVTEAQILNKPTIITNYSTSTNQLRNGFDGVIVSMENEKCANDVAQIIMNKTLQKELINNTKNNDYTNKNEIEKIYRLI